ncbi:MAG: divalent-cation tolerance protein CutA [Verrucomicrobiales bacterium]|nr:divalent-cation tolerance protein CutA [Verrucomicrobiales bacterium]
MDVLLVFSTFPDADTARQIGTMLVESQLAACVNLIPAVESIYRWDGKVQRDAEVLAIIKTAPQGLAALEQRLKEAHPYDTPEIVALKPEAVEARYGAWVRAAVG